MTPHPPWRIPELTPEQEHALTMALAKVLVNDRRRQRLHREHGRLRPSCEPRR